MSSRFTLFAIAITAAACTTPEPPDAASAHVRVAHLSPDAPNIDFCVAPHGTTTFTGPILSSNGHMTGLPYGAVTKYFDLPAEQYDVRLVGPGLADCATPIGNVPDFTDLPAIEAGDSITIGAEGLVAFGSTNPFDLHVYVDQTTVADGSASLRFIHASPGTPAVDVGLGGGVLFTSLFSDISFGGAAGIAGGYITTAPIAGAEISARPHGTFQDALSIDPASLPANAIATAFAIGELSSTTTPLRVLLCVDNAASVGLLTSCTVVGGTPERAHVRIAHLSPDAPPVDVCIAPASTGVFDRMLLKTLGGTIGLAYAQVTAYVDLPVGSYDARIVDANASDCSIGAVKDATGIAVDDDETATIAAIGDLDPSGAAAHDPALHLAAFVDDTSVTAAMTKVRFIHASPGTAAVDVGLGSGVSFVRVFADVAFGTVASADSADNGYVQTSPVATTPVAARLANQSSDALVVPNVSLAANNVTTAIAVGGKTGSSTNPLGLLLCDDNAPASGLLTACAIAN
ncbi:MAG TPA: DUF4397 domain-containing protein [Kofleriaceae bacterium]|nr:DUF4397 domain-containing protein [Kofleriaceae bacterium]